ncbi:MAG: membrane protein insertase YidC [Deltaproteobacteria bacterium HGW-Deltaproteobacteria-11]|nr:MAG: membrane protein insertase YidC [Deltaproteobacteria bacterium HGW-Deltaproteobacteria-11]
MDKKALIAIVLSVLVVFIYQTYFAPPPPPKKPDTTIKETPAAPAAKQAMAPAPERKAPVPAKAKPASAPALIQEKEIAVDTKLYKAVFTTKGGTLKSFKLKDYRKTPAKDAELIELVRIKEGMPGPLGMTFSESDIAIPADGMYETDTTALDLIKTPDRNRLTLSQTYPEQIKVERIYTFNPSGYDLELEVRVHNLSGAPINQNALLSWHEYVDPRIETDSYTHEGPVIFVAKSVEREEVKKITKEIIFGPDVSWGGFETKYFIAAMIPRNPSLTSLVVSQDSRNMVTTSLKGPKHLIPAGQAGLFSYTLFFGPKDHSILKALDVGLENAIDFGSWLKWLAMPMLVILKYINNFVNNYGITIIILTLLIKIAFWPLGNKSYKSMKEMQNLQPQLTAIREKYKGDKQKAGQETMALYKAHKVNPLGGCLPMVVQIPVFFGLYRTLLYAIELRHAPFFWWIQDLSDKDPYYITPIIMGATMFIQQKMSPPAGEPMQQKIMLIMPVVFTFLFLSFPSGLVIYWLFNNILSIGQQYFIMKKK